jgi:peptidoglycan-associated lipoprotein
MSNGRDNPEVSIMVRRTLSRCALAIAGTSVIALAGCQTNGPDQAAANPTGSEFEEGAVPTSDAALVTTGLQTVYFDYDRHVIRSDAKPILDSNASVINENVDWGTVTIEGHCDERGSEEYNVALGGRRASQVKQYLMDLGVSKQRLRTVSFGEAAPAVAGSGESAFQFNRRSEFKAASN